MDSMSIEAPLSKYRKHNLMIWIGILVVLSVWFWYDGHYNQKFIDKHTVNGVANSTLVFNRKSPPVILVIALILAGRFWIIKDKKIVADEKGLEYEKIAIPYDQIESIDRTHFDKKGFFILHYTDSGQKKDLKFSDRQYDNLPAVLDHLVSKITA
jgi:hypothetical protein